MDAPTPASSPTIERDLECVRCHYNLRTLARAGRCPECGLPVAMTLSFGSELANSRPAYGRRLAIACWLLLAARAAAFFAVLLGVTLPSWHGDPWRVIIALALLPYAVGLWVLTGREHRAFTPELRWTTLLLKICGMVLATGWGFVATMIVLQVFGGYPVPRYWVRLVQTSAVVICIAGPALESRLLVHLAKRQAEAWLGEHALIAGIGATLSGELILAIASEPRLIEGRGGLWVVAVSLALLLLFWLWMAVCNAIAAQGFARAARLAAHRWQTASQGNSVRPL